jgi:hypothetical protein
VHQIGPARNADGLEGKGFDQIGLGLRRGRNGRTLVLLVEVVDEPDVNVTFVCGHERAADDVGGLVVQAEVVERELERLLRGLDEPRDEPCNVERRLPAVSQRADGDQGFCFARSEALYARFLAW